MSEQGVLLKNTEYSNLATMQRQNDLELIWRLAEDWNICLETDFACYS